MAVTELLKVFEYFNYNLLITKLGAHPYDKFSLEFIIHI